VASSKEISRAAEPDAFLRGELSRLDDDSCGVEIEETAGREIFFIFSMSALLTLKGQFKLAEPWQDNILPRAPILKRVSSQLFQECVY
jgi:hypothetical protein